MVDAVIVGWDPDLARVPPPKRTEERRQFAPLLTALGRVSQVANPPDLLGPPIHFTLIMKDGARREFELWPPYLADKEQQRLYFLPDDLFMELRKTLERLGPPPIQPPERLSGMLTVADLVRALQEHGAGDARDTGEELPVVLFGAQSGRVIEVLEMKVQVYRLDSPAAAARAAATNPRDMPITWAGKPHFAAVGNLVVTVVSPDEDRARKVLLYLEMVRK